MPPHRGLTRKCPTRQHPAVHKMGWRGLSAWMGRRPFSYCAPSGAGPCEAPARFTSSMAILTSLHHVTRYTSDRPVQRVPQVIRLRPAAHCRVRVPSYSLKVSPANHFVNWQQDPHGNWLARYVFPEKTTEYSVTVDVLAEMAVINPFDF